MYMFYTHSHIHTMYMFYTHSHIQCMYMFYSRYILTKNTINIQDHILNLKIRTYSQYHNRTHHPEYNLYMQ